MNRPQNSRLDWIMTVQENDKIPCKCPKCEHRWPYSGSKENHDWVTCPNCDRKSPLAELRIDGKNE